MEQTTLKPRTIFCRDNLELMRGINSDCIDLIYLDPPFNKGRNFHAPIGTSTKGADFEDIWSRDKVKDAWVEEIEDDHPGIHALVNAVEAIGSQSAKYYLIFMAMRLLEIRRILKPTGSVYLHCDPTADSHLRLLMDAIFGWKNFRNQIVWAYSGGGIPTKDFPRKHDIVLRYTQDCDSEYVFNIERKPYKENTQQVGKHSTLSGGKLIDLVVAFNLLKPSFAFGDDLVRLCLPDELLGTLVALLEEAMNGFDQLRQ